MPEESPCSSARRANGLVQTLFSALNYQIVGKQGNNRTCPPTAPETSLSKSIGRRPPPHIHNPSELMLFTRWSSQ
jgi:hypothetical protein